MATRKSTSEIPNTKDVKIEKVELTNWTQLLSEYPRLGDFYDVANCEAHKQAESAWLNKLKQTLKL